MSFLQSFVYKFTGVLFFNLKQYFKKKQSFKKGHKVIFVLTFNVSTSKIIDILFFFIIQYIIYEHYKNLYKQ